MQQDTAGNDSTLLPPSTRLSLGKASAELVEAGADVNLLSFLPTDDESTLVKEGTLYKAGGAFKQSYQERWFRLWSDKKLSYFTPDREERRGDISLIEYMADNVRIKPCNTVEIYESYRNRSQAYAFEILPTVTHRVYGLAAKTEEERAEWIVALKKVIGQPSKQSDFRPRPKKESIADAFAMKKGQTEAERLKEVEHELLIGNYDSAHEKAKLYLKLDLRNQAKKINPQYYDLMGRAAIGKRQIDTALQYYTKACDHVRHVESFGRTTEAIYVMRYADLLLRKNEIEKASLKIAEARHIDSQSPYVLACSGLVCTAKHEFNEAEKFFEKALSHVRKLNSPPLEEYYVLNGCKKFYYITQQWKPAIGQAKRLLSFEVNTAKWETYFFLARIYRDLCRWEECETMLKEGLKLQPDDFFLHTEYLLLKLFSPKSSPEDSKSYFSCHIGARFKKENPCHWYYRVLDALVRDACGEHAQAKKIFDNILRTSNDLSYVPLAFVMSLHILHICFAMFYQLSEENCSKAQPYWKNIVEKYAPNLAIGHYYYHKCLFEDQQFELANEHLETANYLNPGIAVIKNNYDIDKNLLQIALRSARQQSMMQPIVNISSRSVLQNAGASDRSLPHSFVSSRSIYIDDDAKADYIPCFKPTRFESSRQVPRKGASFDVVSSGAGFHAQKKRQLRALSASLPPFPEQEHESERLSLASLSSKHSPAVQRAPINQKKQSSSRRNALARAQGTSFLPEGVSLVKLIKKENDRIENQPLSADDNAVIDQSTINPTIFDTHRALWDCDTNGGCDPAGEEDVDDLFAYIPREQAGSVAAAAMSEFDGRGSAARSNTAVEGFDRTGEDLGGLVDSTSDIFASLSVPQGPPPP